MDDILDFLFARGKIARLIVLIRANHHRASADQVCVRKGIVDLVLLFVLCG